MATPLTLEEQLLIYLATTGLKSLTYNNPLIRLIDMDGKAEKADKGQTVLIPYTGWMDGREIETAMNNPAKNTTNAKVYNIPISLNYAWEVPIPHDPEQLSIAYENKLMPEFAVEATNSIRRYVTSNVMNLYKKIPHVVGTPGTKLFNNTDAELIEINQKLIDNLAPMDNLSIVTDSISYTTATSTFKLAYEYGDDSIIKSGRITKAMGFNFHVEQAMPRHIAGDAVGLQTAAVGNVGDTTLSVTATSGGLNEGDILTPDGSEYTYVVESDVVDATTATVSVYPPLKEEILSGVTLDITPDHNVSLAFHKSAFQLVMRLFNDTSENKRLTLSDPRTGIVMGTSIANGHRMKEWLYDVLFGVLAKRRDFAVRVIS